MSGEARRAWALALGLCLLVAGLDQGAKAIAEDRIAPGESVDLLGPLQFTLSHNTGAAFGVAGGEGWALVALALCALALVGVLFARDPDRPGMWVAVGLVGGGALGNLIDRVFSGEVTDYIDLPSWPPFNLADVGIVVGVALLALIQMREGPR